MDNFTGLSSDNKFNQNLHLLGVGLHVDMIARFSSYYYYHYLCALLYRAICPCKGSRVVMALIHLFISFM